MSDLQSKYNRILIFIPIFFVLYFPRRYQFLFLSLLPFEKKNILQRRVITTKLSTARRAGVHAWMGYQIRIPHVVLNNFFLFLPFFSPSISMAILVTTELPVFCHVFFYFCTILFKSFRHVCIHLWSIYLQYCIDNSEMLCLNSPEISCLLVVQNS